MATESDRAVEEGNALLDAGDVAGAEAAFRRAAELDPAWSVPHFNLGLLCKRQSRWPESLAFNQRAVRLDATDQGAWWNLGIAATALGRWAEARRAWTGCGLPVPPGQGPPDMPSGRVPIRLNPADAGEVVWADRLDPARARLRSIPLPASGFRWGDLVLHDGAPNGYRMLEGRQVPVFDVLVRLEQSPLVTFVVQLGTLDPHAIEELERIAGSSGGAAENWGTTTTVLCRECSLGLPHTHPEPGQGTSAHPHCGLAARDQEHLLAILNAWLAATPGSDLVGWAPGVEGPDR